MKRFFLTLLLIAILWSCKNDTSNKDAIVDNLKTDLKSKVSVLEGNWEMVGYYNYRDNKIVDSFSTDKSHRQVKMFNKNKVMWSKLMPENEIEWFGYGSYTATDSTLTELMQYGSNVMNKIIADQQEFSYKLLITDSTFSQIRVDDDGEMVYSENYKRID
ncbi:hypothetical protein ACFQ1Q_09620 [Winogradskyella litorisediminis]|uniref:Lipocalin-like domain-containing protein n=1 Tax=Winogradskyella litorisediminis TaxID=1156618 RepID=A0ABW3N795_9FLAO